MGRKGRTRESLHVFVFGLWSVRLCFSASRFVVLFVVVGFGPLVVASYSSTSFPFVGPGFGYVSSAVMSIVNSGQMKLKSFFYYYLGLMWAAVWPIKNPVIELKMIYSQKMNNK